MRKLLTIVAGSVAAAMTLSACGANSASTGSPEAGEKTKVVVGASPVPHARILEYVRDNLAADAGIEIEIKEFDDYVLPNEALAAGELDANYFQHLPFFEAQVAEKGYEFEHGEGVHIEPYAAFSSKYENIADLPDEARILITNDASNQGRGLGLLEEAGLLKELTPESTALTLTETQNPKRLKFLEDQPEIIVQQMADPTVDLAFVNGNFILSAGLDSSEALLIEKVENNPYANFLAWRKDNKNDAVAKLDELLHSDQVRNYIKETWPTGSVIASQ